MQAKITLQAAIFIDFSTNLARLAKPHPGGGVRKSEFLSGQGNSPDRSGVQLQVLDFNAKILAKSGNRDGSTIPGVGAGRNQCCQESRRRADNRRPMAFQPGAHCGSRPESGPVCPAAGNLLQDLSQGQDISVRDIDIDTTKQCHGRRPGNNKEGLNRERQAQGNRHDPHRQRRPSRASGRSLTYPLAGTARYPLRTGHRRARKGPEPCPRSSWWSFRNSSSPSTGGFSRTQHNRSHTGSATSSTGRVIRPGSDTKVKPSGAKGDGRLFHEISTSSEKRRK